MASMLHSLRPYPHLAERLPDRQVGHAVTMAALPGGLGQSARAKAACLWRYEAESGLMHVQADCEVNVAALGTPVSSLERTPAPAGSCWSVDLAVNCQRTPPSDVPVELRPALKQSGRCYRSRMVVVPEHARAEWAIARMARSGFAVDPHSLVVGKLGIADLGRRGGGIPYVRLTATGSVGDAEAWEKALRLGIGKGRNFGLGLVLTQPSD